MGSEFSCSLSSTSILPSFQFAVLIWLLKFSMEFSIFLCKKASQGIKDSNTSQLFLVIKAPSLDVPHLCLLCSSTWCKAETFTSPHFVLSFFFHFSKVWFLNVPTSLNPLHGHQEKSQKRDRNTLLSVLDHGVMVTPGCQEKCWRALSAWETIQLNFSNTLWKVYTRDHSYLTNFHLIL